MTLTYARILVAVLSAALPLLGSCGCAAELAGRKSDVGTGGALGNVGPGASVHLLALTDGTAWVSAAIALVLAAAVAWLLWKHQPSDPPASSSRSKP